MKISEKIVALVFNKDNLMDYQLGDMNEIMNINIFDDLGFDSIQFVELIISIEREFNFEIDESVLTMGNFSTIRQIVDFISERICGEASDSYDQ